MNETLAVEAAYILSQLHDNCIIIFNVKENMQLSKMPLYETGPLERQATHGGHNLLFLSEV